VVQRVPGLVALELADQAVTQQIEVANGVEDLVLDELIFVTKTIFIEHIELIDNDGVVHAATQRQVLRTQVFDITHETEGAGATDFLDEGGAGKVDTGRLGTSTEHRMIEIDLEA